MANYAKLRSDEARILHNGKILSKDTLLNYGYDAEDNFYLVIGRTIYTSYQSTMFDFVEIPEPTEQEKINSVFPNGFNSYMKTYSLLFLQYEQLLNNSADRIEYSKLAEFQNAGGMYGIILELKNLALQFEKDHPASIWEKYNKNFEETIQLAFLDYAFSNCAKLTGDFGHVWVDIEDGQVTASLITDYSSDYQDIVRVDLDEFEKQSGEPLEADDYDIVSLSWHMKDGSYCHHTAYWEVRKEQK